MKLGHYKQWKEDQKISRHVKVHRRATLHGWHFGTDVIMAVKYHWPRKRTQGRSHSNEGKESRVPGYFSARCSATTFLTKSEGLTEQNGLF